MTFLNREDAGRQLAEKVNKRTFLDPLVLGIPRGGVVIAAVLARELGAELDVVLARKLRAPGQPELAVGAIAEDGRVYLNPEAKEALGLSEEYVAREMSEQMKAIERRKKLFRAHRPPAVIHGRSVIVTDDGIATGSTMMAALQVIRDQQPHELIVAVPVASPDRRRPLRRWCDEVVCLHAPAAFWAIGQFYEDFAQVDDDTVVDLLRRSAPARKADDSHSRKNKE